LKTGVEKKNIRILTPLLDMTKAEIVQLGQNLGVPFAKTWSCYNGAGKVCGVCDSCRLRAGGFADAGIVDPVAGRLKRKNV
jgi:7-cyano-7-deazaguanine synthase